MELYGSLWARARTLMGPLGPIWGPMAPGQDPYGVPRPKWARAQGPNEWAQQGPNESPRMGPNGPGLRLTPILHITPQVVRVALGHFRVQQMNGPNRAQQMNGPNRAQMNPLELTSQNFPECIYIYIYIYGTVV